MVKRTASIEEVLAAIETGRDKVMADEVKSLRNQEEAEPDPFEGNTTSWEEIG